MANPRQRRKSRSATHTGPSRRSKREMKKKLVRAPTVKGPEILKQSWDPKLTVRQNYAKLGLVSGLDISAAGGVEDLDSYKVPSQFQNNEKDDDAEPSTSTTAKPKKGMGRIIKDLEGKIIDIIEGQSESESEDQDQGEGSSSSKNPWGKLGEGGDENSSEKTQLEEKKLALKMSKFPEPLKGKGKDSSSSSSKVIEKLMELEKNEKPVPRHVSLGRHQWLKDLIEKYDDDFEGMAKDRRLNVLQKTEGEIKRSIKKAGGKEEILKGFESQR